MLAQYLQLPFRKGNIEYKSPYMAALTDARAAAGRNVETGEIIEPDKVGSWAGALAYMVLIDHIGTNISKVIDGNTDQTKFIKALKDFTDLPETHIYALYALRCAFAHQYSLINIGKGNNSGLKHHQFEVHRGDTLVTLPNPAWDGEPTPATAHLITSVSLKKLGDLVEDIHVKLQTLVAANQIFNEHPLMLLHYPV